MITENLILYTSAFTMWIIGVVLTATVLQSRDPEEARWVVWARLGVALTCAVCSFGLIHLVKFA
jgi:hypothetical protein